jgi:hypothetical protein
MHLHRSNAFPAIFPCFPFAEIGCESTFRRPPSRTIFTLTNGWKGPRPTKFLIELLHSAEFYDESKEKPKIPRPPERVHAVREREPKENVAIIPDGIEQGHKQALGKRVEVAERGREEEVLRASESNRAAAQKGVSRYLRGRDQGRESGASGD